MIILILVSIIVQYLNVELSIRKTTFSGKTRSTRSGKKSVVASVHSMQYISEVQEDQEGDEWEEEVPQLRLDIDEEQSSKSEVF